MPLPSKGWIGVDLDGTLAVYDEWRGLDHVGKPIPLMVNRVKKWLEEGKDVRIFTARVAGDDRGEAAHAINMWSIEVFGKALPTTHCKNMAMIELWDDRVVQVVKNTGKAVEEAPHCDTCECDYF